MKKFFNIFKFSHKTDVIEALMKSKIFQLDNNPDIILVTQELPTRKSFVYTQESNRVEN